MVRIFRKKYPAKFSDESIFLHPLFADLKPSQLSEIEVFFQENSYDAGAVLLLSDPDNALFAIIKNGAAHVTETLSNGRGENAFDVTRGESFGEANLVDPGFSVLECRFIEPSDLLVLTHENFQKMVNTMCRGAIGLYLNLSNCISERLVQLNKEYITLYYDNIIEAGNSK